MANLREDILAAKNNVFSGQLIGANREINKLINYLHSNETVNYICPGDYDENRGIIVLTNERVIFLKDTLFAKTNQDFPYKSITSVEWKSRILYGDVVLFSESFQEVRISKVPRNHGFTAVKMIREGMRDGSLPLFVSNSSGQISPSVSIPTATLVTVSQTQIIPLSLEERKKDLLAKLDKDYDDDIINHTEYLKQRGAINRMQ